MTTTRIHQEGEPSPPWCTGWARYHVDEGNASRPMTVAVRCRTSGQATPELALFDTGAHWSLIGGDLAADIENSRQATNLGQQIKVNTRLGQYEGRMFRVDLDLLADEGQDLSINCTVLLSRAWPGPAVLGYHGLMEFIRFGMDPGIHGDPESAEWLCFGADR